MSSVPKWGQLPAYAQNAFVMIDPDYGGGWFDSLGDGRRLSLLNVFVKMRKFGFWGYILDFSNPDDWRDPATGMALPGPVHFLCTNVGSLKHALTRSPAFVSPAASGNWNSAEITAGTSLHFKQFNPASDLVQVHVDLQWGWMGPSHWLTYKSYKDPFKIREALLSEGFDGGVLKGRRSA